MACAPSQVSTGCDPHISRTRQAKGHISQGVPLPFPKRLLGLLVALMVVSLGPTASAKGRGPSTPEERARVLHLTTASEANLPSGLSDQDRTWFLAFIQEVPDLTFSAGPVGAWCVKSVKMSQAAAVVFHFMLAAVAFQIEHPDKAQDAEAVDQAALESCLRAYQNLVKASPDARSTELDRAAALRDQGALAAFVRQLRAKKK